MSFPRSEPRPYVVTIRDTNGVVVMKHVVAYDIQEAAVAANLEFQSEGGEVEQLLSVRPDEEAIRERRRQGSVDQVTKRLLGSMDDE